MRAPPEVVRVALLTEIPAPYRIPLFNALAAMPGIELDVILLAERDPRHMYQVYREEFDFRDTVLGGRSLVRGGRWLMLTTGLGRALRRIHPDAVVVSGWSQPAFWNALGRSALRRIPTILWVESTSRDARIAGAGAELIRRAAIRLSSGYVVPGSAAAEYVRSLGATAGRIAVAPNAVDLEIFGVRVAQLRSERDALRERLGLRRPTFLYVGRLEREKGPDVLVRAAADVDADVVIVGGGSLERELHELAPSGGVRFVGPVARDELVAWYAAADVLVLPSRSDTWGMVLNEGAAAGLPLVASDVAGGAYDLIEDGVNGFRFASEDVGALSAAMRTLAGDERLRAEAGRRSAELSERFRPEAWAEAVAQLVRQLAGAR